MANILINGNEGKMLTKQDIERIIENAHEEIFIAKKDIAALTDVINEKKVAISEMEIELEKTKTVKTGYERREKRGRYFFVNGSSQSVCDIELYSTADNAHFEMGNYMSQENAERMAKATRLNFLLDRFTRENGWDDKLWEDANEFKYCITRDYFGIDKEIGVDYFMTSKPQGTVYFASRAIAEQAIEKFRDLLEEVL